MPGAITLALMASAAMTAIPADEELQSVYLVPSVVVTASRGSQGVNAALIGSSLSVIPPDVLEDRQVRIVTDVLRDIPGVAVSRSGAVGNFTQVRIRGAEANHVLVLIDGVEAADPFSGEFNFATLLADDQARIEVLRGQQSALYGSDAIAGVINYITPSGREQSGASLRIEGGSFGTVGAAGRVATAGERSDIVLSGGYQYSDGYATAVNGSRHVGSDIATLGLKGLLDVSPTIKISGGVRWTYIDADVNGQDYATGFVIDTPGAYGISDSLYSNVGLQIAPEASAWQHNLAFQYVVSDKDDYSADGRTGGGKGERTKASYVASLTRFQGELEHRLNAALDFEREAFRNTGPYDPWGADLSERHTDNVGVVLQYDLNSAYEWGGGFALRHDHNDAFLSATTYRLHGFYKPVETLRLRAAAGSGIKNPGQTELFGYNASAYPFIGNPSLKPERSEGWEAGLDWTFAERFNLDLTYFNARLKDEIYGVYDADPALCAVPGQPLPLSCSTTGNRQTISRQQGVELALDARLTNWVQLYASYTYLDAVEGGVQEIRRPPHVASANVHFHSPSRRGKLTATVRYNGEATDTDFASFPARTVTLDPFWLVNLAGAWALTEKVELFGRIENLLDEQYQEVLNFRGAPRAAYAGVRVKF